MITDKNPTLSEALKEFSLDKQEDIPWIIRLLENPLSPVALPGKISYYNHDCIHVLLKRGLSLADEAFVIGFTMGNNPNTKPWHKKVYKFFSRYLYPVKYRFLPKHFKVFDLGFNYGKSLNTQFDKIDFKKYQDFPVSALRKIWGISEEHLLFLSRIELESNYQPFLRESINPKSRKKKLKLFKLNTLKISSSIFAFCGGLMLALNNSWSGYGFIFLACSSSQMLIASVLEKDKIMMCYSGTLFTCVDLIGIYFWLFAK